MTTTVIPPFSSSVVPNDETAAQAVEIMKQEIEDYLAALIKSIPTYSSPVVVTSAEVDLPNIVSNGSASVDVTVTVPLGTHIISWAALTDATSIEDLIIQIIVVAANTVRFTMQNPTGGAIDPDPITFQFITATATDTP